MSRATTVIAVVEVGAVEALVTNARDGLVTTIADSVVADIATRRCKRRLVSRQNAGRSSSSEAVAWVMTVLVGSVALEAKIIVLAVLASDKHVFREH